MNQKHYLWRVSVCIVVAALLLTACGGGETTTPVVENSATTTESTGETPAVTVAPAEPTATPEPRDRIPEILVVHPDAFDFEVTEATNTYVYVVPIMVADTTAYLETELKARGWEELGKPTVMGHLATLIMQREGYRLTVSMQDNERSMTTRVQMLLMEQ
ncbi:MAG TPA: hypothetical protein PLH19_10495 [Anaerolineae bacterium]|nr:hypothetical protein [Anaerolineae bacterium]HQH38945.1 hypothetical protein [Anaerolineae bacterium]